MPKTSLLDHHPDEASRLSALLNRLQKASKKPQKILARELTISEAALSRSLNGKAVLPEPSLTLFLKLTGANAEDQAEATRLMGIITGSIQPSGPPPPPGQGGERPRPRVALIASQVRKRLRKGLVAAAAVIIPCLWAAGSIDGRVEPLPAASSTAWSKPLPEGRPGFYGHAVIYRQLGLLVLFDDYGDGRSAIVDVKINGKRPLPPWYNYYGKTDVSHPPMVINLAEYGFKPTDTVEYQVCAGEVKNRGEPLKHCGQPVVDRPTTRPGGP